MTRIPVSIPSAALLSTLLCPANAATKKVRVPNRYDGSWTIVAATAQGPCSASTSYQVKIKDGDASVPGDEIDIDGGVSANGSVQATITKGSSKQVQKYEKGRNRIGAGRLQAIADLLHVPVETFFSGQSGSVDGAVPAPTFFDDPKVMELVMAFTSISDETTRDGVLSIVKAATSLRRGIAKA